MSTIFLMLILFEIKHFLFDFVFQTKYHLGKFNADGSFYWPLVSHSAWVACLTPAILGIAGYGRHVELVAIAWGIDFWSHFFIDRLKAGPKYLGRFKALSAQEYQVCNKAVYNSQIYYDINGNQKFMDTPEALKKLRGNWMYFVSIGIDQMAHHLVYLAIIYMAVSW